jgi:EF hand
MPCRSARGFRTAIVGLAACIFFTTRSLAAQEVQAFKGEIKDCTCSRAAGPTAVAEPSPTIELCATASMRKGAKYILLSPEKKTVYQLDNQKKPKAFAGEDVVVLGSLDETNGMIHVSEIFQALSPKVAQAKTVAIVCDACLRGMAAATPAAFEELADWGRFEVVANRKKADLIFLFSANPYLGDYVTRDGPDIRPVRVDITFMNVVDPRTGESLWGGSRQWGSWFVAKATNDLMIAFRKQLEAADGSAERLLLRMDRNRDGGVSKQEFLDYMDAEFDRLDTDKNGKLDADELKQLRILNVGGEPSAPAWPLPAEITHSEGGPD